MEANEAPEKLYFTSNENGTHYYTEGIPFEREYIEYVQTDAFIEKTCEWFRTLDDKEPLYRTTEEFIEGFRKYMEE